MKMIDTLNPLILEFWSGSYRTIHTGSLNGNAGVGILLRKSAGMRVKSFLKYNERIVTVK